MHNSVPLCTTGSPATDTIGRNNVKNTAEEFPLWHNGILGVSGVLGHKFNPQSWELHMPQGAKKKKKKKKSVKMRAKCEKKINSIVLRIY